MYFYNFGGGTEGRFAFTWVLFCLVYYGVVYCKKRNKIPSFLLFSYVVPIQSSMPPEFFQVGNLCHFLIKKTKNLLSALW